MVGSSDESGRLHGCRDEAATNYEAPPADANASSRSAWDNSACKYTCAALCRYFDAWASSSCSCLIDDGDTRWPSPNATITLQPGTTLVVQGRATSGGGALAAAAGRTLLSARIVSAGGTVVGGSSAALVLRHVAMMGQTARADELGNLGDGGAINAQRSNLTVEFCVRVCPYPSPGPALTLPAAAVAQVFRGNHADSGGAIAASGQRISIRDSVFENNTALSSGGALFVTGLPMGSDAGRSAIAGQKPRHPSPPPPPPPPPGGTALEVRGCAFTNNSAATYGGGLFIKNDQLLERFVCTSLRSALFLWS